MAKMGRPTTNPRVHHVTIRLTEEERETLIEYCEKHRTTTTQAVSMAVMLLRQHMDTKKE